FQCLIVDPAASSADAEVVERAVALGGATLRARELRVPSIAADARGQVRLFRQLARLLAPAAAYDRFASRADSAVARDERATAALLAAPDYALTRLELLRDAD